MSIGDKMDSKCLICEREIRLEEENYEPLECLVNADYSRYIHKDCLHSTSVEFVHTKIGFICSMYKTIRDEYLNILD